MRVLGAVVLFCCYITLSSAALPPKLPPIITRQSDHKSLLVETGDIVQLPCTAAANLLPISYRWEFNGRPLDPRGDPNVVMLPGHGTLIIRRASAPYVPGYYQCFASNDYGTAVSDMVHLFKAEMGFFAREKPSERQIQVDNGDSLRLLCNQPSSFPEAETNWFKLSDDGRRLLVTSSERLIVDPDGGLNFAAIQISDSGSYSCAVYNRFMRRVLYSPNRYTIQVKGGVAVDRNVAFKNWIPRFLETPKKGDAASLYCIPTGLPVPQIEWRRTDGVNIGSSAQVWEFGRELYFPAIAPEDSGRYECVASNNITQTAVRAMILVNVLERVSWVRKPIPITTEEGSNVTFTCQATGRPLCSPPRWFINGAELAGSSENRVIGDEYGPATTLSILNTDRVKDTMAIQCNVTNNLEDSWVFSSFYLNVKESNQTTVV